MSKLIDLLKDHYKTKLSSPLDFIEVEELGDEDGPLKIYFGRMTLAQQGRIYEAMASGNLDFMAKSLIERALDENGNAMLKSVDLTELRLRVDGELLQNICAKMSEKQGAELPDDPEVVEKAEKK